MIDKKDFIPEQGERLDTLSGDFVIVQPEIGQRYSTDDMLVGWLVLKVLSEKKRDTDRLLDLGSGLCSVPMIILWGEEALGGIGVEIRKERYKMGKKSLQLNKLDQRFELLNGDLRSLNLEEIFDIVSSSPPYYEKREGPISGHSDKAGARFELNGSIEDYFIIAEKHLKNGGLFFTVYPFQYKDRVYDAAEKYDLRLDTEVDIVPREGKPELITVFAFVKGVGGRNIRGSLTVRKSDGSFSNEYRKAREFVGFPDKEK